mmetsp:Transcript_110418/g.237624  ORF Transcript_110418/g.237624 Transcript_110418/m.237624 type:complete len:82 (-) Transcript_110418:21-266(-)
MYKEHHTDYNFFSQLFKNFMFSRVPAKNIDMIREMFVEHDKDHNGKVDFDEFKTICLQFDLKETQIITLWERINMFNDEVQ